MAQEIFDTIIYDDSALKAYYRFNSGALTTDSKGSFTLTNNNSVGENASGYVGYAADFGNPNTTKDFNINDNIGIDGGAITLGCWVKPTATPGLGANETAMIQGSASSDVNYFFQWQESAGGDQSFTFNRQKIGDSTDIVTTSTVGLTTGSWNLLILTYDGSNMYGYLNGTQYGPGAASGNGSSGGSDRLYIGSIQGSQHTNGLLDESIVMNRALTLQEATAWWNSALPNRYNSSLLGGL